MCERLERIRCERCSQEGPYVGHLDPIRAMEAAERAGFVEVLVHSGLRPWYRWECRECREFDARMGREREGGDL